MSGSSLRFVYDVVRKCWTQECLQCLPKVSYDVADRWLATIKRNYSEPQRKYHTLKHVAVMLDDFHKCVQHIKEPKLIAWAIIFHDIVYDPKAADNEERSAELFAKCAEEMSLEAANTEKVLDWILKTKTHKTTIHTTPRMFGSDDVHYLLDLDMAILGSSHADYDEYASEIRQEYIHVPERLYNTRRSEVLQTFLQQTNIYATKEFRGKLEEQARLNIKREIDRLKGEDCGR